ncbi:MAG: AI-2E family transporter [Flavobacteriaceae bacterium]|nr:AI-2E family transporter [Flavobacteriaceae bacterium]
MMDTKKTNNSLYDTIIRLVILFLIIAWCLLILQPFVSILLWSVILALAINPLHTSISKKMGKKPKLASFLIVFIFLLVIFVPSWLLIDQMADEVKLMKENFSKGTLTIPPPTEKVKEWPVIGENLFDFWQGASENLKQTLIKHKDQLEESGKKLVKGLLSTASAVIQIMVSLIIAGILLAIGGAGERVRKFFRKLAGTRGDEFADMTVKTVNNVVKGVIGVALILAFLHGILFVLAGIPFPGILTLLIFVLAVLQIPALIVSLPVIIYIFSVKDTTAAVIWTVLFLLAGLSDNVLKPLLLSARGLLFPCW